MEYSAKNIKVLKGLEAVRKRPGMYIGDTGERGLHHLIFEVVDNSIDEAMAGYAHTIEVIIHSDGSVQIVDDGRGIPTDLHPYEKLPAATLVLTTLHAGGKFDSKTYKVSGGLHGVGVSVVNALSQWLEMVIYRKGKIYRQKFQQGKPVTDLEVIGKTAQQGTSIRFYPDPAIFPNTIFNKDIIQRRLKELAYLNPGVNIKFIDKRDGTKLNYHFEGGIRDFLKELTKGSPLITPIYFFNASTYRGRKVELEVAFLYDSSYEDKLASYVNNIRTGEGGTHETGFKGGLTRAVLGYIEKNYKLRDLKVQSEDIREGLKGIINLKLTEPQFEGQTKTKLGDSFIRGMVQRWTYEFLTRYFEENPNSARKIADRAIGAAKSRIAAKRARDLIRKQLKISAIATLPGKLTDCQSKNPEERELYLVEGDSAGGSAKQGRDRRFQAILPLRGKILNSQKSSNLKLLESEEIKNIITALGTGINEELELSKLRYHKIIIMTDADVDGSHIQTLIMTFFFNNMRPIIEKGHLYIAQPPLYRYKKGRREIYLKDEQELYRLLIEEGLKGIELPTGLNYFQVGKWLEQVGIYQQILEKLEKLFGIGRVIRFLIEGGKLEEVEEFLKSQGYRIVSKSEEKWYIQTDKGVEELKVGEELIHYPLFKEGKKLYRQIAPLATQLKVDPLQMLKEVINRGLKGADIQRYKGLGEMNPDQLWETTMNPKNRRLLQVRLEDGEKANQWFELFMGSEVAPRREFIQKHAREVENIDT